MSIYVKPMTDDSKLDALWQRHRAGDRVAYEELVEAYLPLVKTSVGRMALTIPAHVSREELYSAGCMGLLSAVERYDPTREAKFTTYAITRIRGSILDELRSNDVLGRVTRDRVTRITRAKGELRNNDAEVTAEAIAETAGLSMSEYWDAQLNQIAAKRISLSEASDDGEHTLEDMLAGKNKDEPGEKMELDEILDAIQEILTEKEKMLVVLYYTEGLTLKEIGVIWDVSESRVCQLHTAMADRVRKKLEKIGIFL